MVQFTCDPREVQDVKDALGQIALNLGVGILHEPTGRISLLPMDRLPNRGGHNELVQLFNVPSSECKGFVIVKANDGFLPVNISHLNGIQGQPGSLQMPPVTFSEIVQALTSAGL
jgi:hypothetical protein